MCLLGILRKGNGMRKAIIGILPNVIPMIAFIEGGMRIPIGTITRDYLRAHMLAPTQYKNAIVPNFSLVFQSSSNKILKAEVFVHSYGQLRVAHIILGYTPISKSFQVPKCVIKAKDLHLHRISVAAPGFLTTGAIPEGILTTDPILEGILTTDPILEGIPKVALPLQYTTGETTSSHPAAKEEEEEERKEEEKEKEEEVFKVSDSEDEFAIFNLLRSLEAQIGDFSHFPLVQLSSTQEDTIVLEEMGI
ncbi:hypothetical protein SO802_000090 [Lithocarpus litseifolius]|uniref:Uncharacterized protein n=1 Tax=Lithocarpus litseifolius TaxID=425828 RepID=A0AAW2DVS9_9ROSI